MIQVFFGNIYNPDVLTCIVNLSNDEVFTPPDIANAMLDMLPQELFSCPDATFLDPACKSGVFLREIAKRLIKGLEDKIPDLQERIDHIFHKQIYGIAITELTSLLSRQSLYCSKYPNSKYSVSHFDTAEGNIRYKRIEHTFKNGKCVYCGATEKQYSRGEELETHAYEFIHRLKPEEIFNMKFDVIISNPPYQINDGGGTGSSAMPIYHHFVKQAKKLNPNYITMIIPARWYAGGKGLDSFRSQMLNDNHITQLHDFLNASDCFNGVEIKGGVCYFLWDKNKFGDCLITTHNKNKIISQMVRPLIEKGCETFIRYNDAVKVLRKISSFGESTFDELVSHRKPFAISSNFSDYTNEKSERNTVQIFLLKNKGYISKNKISKNIDCIDKWKIFIPKAIGSGNMNTDIVKPLLGSPNTVCSETYLMIGPVINQEYAQNIISYINTKFFHFLLGLKKITHNTTSATYSFIPKQDFSQSWSDEKLYLKYGLTEDEITFIENSVWSDKD